MSNLDELLAPISADQATGPDLRMIDGDVTFDELRDLVSVGAPVEGEDPDEPDWAAAARLCESTLRERSKDLELITQLCAAWAHLDGGAGLGRGLQLMKRSLEAYWKEIHPGFDPEDGEITLALRARWLNWMDSPRGMLAAVRQAPLFRAGSARSCSWTDYENSALFDDPSTSAERREELTAAGVMSPSEWQSAVGAASPGELQELAESLAASLEEARAIAAFCREPFEAEDEDPPDLYHLIELLESMLALFGEQSGAAGTASDVLAAVETDGTAAPSGAAQAVHPAAPATPGVLQSRADALRQLEEVGAFFRRTEPHSPISYLISRAVKWGSMPLDRLLKDVVRDDGVIEHIWETLGLDASEDGGVRDDDEDED